MLFSSYCWLNLYSKQIKTFFYNLDAPITDQFEEAGDNLTIHENSPVEEQRGVYDADNELDSLLDYLGVHYDIPNYYGTGQGHGFDNLGGYEEGQGDYDFDNYEGGFEDDREEGFDYYRDYDEYTITDPDENLDILEDEDVDEDADEEDFYQEPGVIEPSPDLYYSTLLMYSQQSFNVIKQPFNPFTTGDLPGRP